MTHSFVLIWIKGTQFFSLIKTQGINSYFGGRQRKSGRWSCSCFLAVCNHCFVQIKKLFPKISISLSDVTLHPKCGVLDSNSQTYFLLLFFPFFLLLFLSLSLEKMGLLKSNSQIFSSSSFSSSFFVFYFYFCIWRKWDCLKAILRLFPPFLFSSSFIFVFGENVTAQKQFPVTNPAACMRQNLHQPNTKLS